jgi:homoserine/homoserine lactone efflux protein
MTLEVWIAFVAASAILLATPGPTVLIAVSHAVDQGKIAAWPVVLGATLGDFIAMTGSLLGAGALLNASAFLFALLKWFGVAYLLWSGASLLFQRSNPATMSKRKIIAGPKQMFVSAFTVTALHPGGFVFFIAFVPLFVNPTRPVFAQFALLEMTFLGLAAINISLWVLLASTARKHLKSGHALGAFKKIGGALLIAFGLGLAFSDVRNK